MFDELFARFRTTPAAQGLLRRVESGGALTCGGVTGSGHAFLAAWLHREFPNRPVVLVAENLKAQESLHQDLETWLGAEGQSPKSKVQGRRTLHPIGHRPSPISGSSPRGKSCRTRTSFRTRMSSANGWKRWLN
jgi:hypothetical protein